MANPYYTFGPSFVPGTKVRSDQVNTQYSAIETGFDLLPSDSASLALATTTFAGTTGGTGNAYTAAAPNTRLSNADGEELIFIADRANTGPATLNVDSIGAQSIVRPDGEVLASGDLQPGIIYGVRYDLTNSRWQLMVPATSYLTDAETAATASAASAAAALVSEGNAATSASASATSASNALTSEGLAAEWASNPVDDDVTGSGGQFSALHWSAGAQEWATRAEDSLIPTNFGGNGVDDYSAYHWAQKAAASSGLPAGTTNDTLSFSGGAWAVSTKLFNDANGISVTGQDTGTNGGRVTLHGAPTFPDSYMWQSGGNLLGYVDTVRWLVASTGAVTLYAGTGNAQMALSSGQLGLTNTQALSVSDTTNTSALSAIFYQAEGGISIRTDGGSAALWQATNVGGIEEIWINMAQNGAVTLYNNGSEALATTTTGVDFYDTSGQNAQINFRGDDGTLLGSISYSNSSAAFKSLTHGVETYIRGENGSGSERTMVQLDPSGTVQLNHPGTNTGSLSTEAYGVQILGTGAIRVSDGTTAQEPTPENGMLRYDTTTNKLRAVEGGVWTDVIGAGGASALNDLSDVTLTTPVTGALLVKSAGDWLDSSELTFASNQLKFDPTSGASEIRMSEGGSTVDFVLTHVNPLISVETTFGYTNGFDFLRSTPSGTLQLDGGSGIVTINSTNRIRFEDDAISGEYFELTNSGGDWSFDNNTHGGRFLFIGEDTGGAVATMMTLDPDGAAALYHDNSLKITTTTGGASIENGTGSALLVVTGQDAAGTEGGQINLEGAGTDTYVAIDNFDGDMRLLVNDGSEVALSAVSNAEVNLYHNSVLVARTATRANGGLELTLDGTDWNRVYGQQTIIKASDTTRNTTTTLAADPDLSVALSAGNYKVEVWLLVQADSGTPDIKVAMDFSGALNDSRGGVWTGPATGTSASGAGDVRVETFTATPVGQPFGCPTSSTFCHLVHFVGLFDANGTGTLAVHWAQNVSDANATRVMRLSRMEITPIEA